LQTFWEYAMKTLIAGSLAALTAGSALAAAVPAAAAPHHYRHGRGDAGAAVAAGIAGLAIGAALASGGRHDGYAYDRPYYGYGYSYGYAPRAYGYAPAPAYGYGRPYYDRCRTEWRWNYRWGGYDRVRVCY
jgi:hypothetical protein